MQLKIKEEQKFVLIRINEIILTNATTPPPTLVITKTIDQKGTPDTTDDVITSYSIPSSAFEYKVNNEEQTLSSGSIILKTTDETQIFTFEYITPNFVYTVSGDEDITNGEMTVEYGLCTSTVAVTVTEETINQPASA